MELPFASFTYVFTFYEDYTNLSSVITSSKYIFVAMFVTFRALEYYMKYPATCVFFSTRTFIFRARRFIR